MSDPWQLPITASSPLGHAMPSIVSLIETRERLRALREMLDCQEKLLRSLKEGEGRLAFAGHFLRGLEAIIDRLERELSNDVLQGVTKH